MFRLILDPFRTLLREIQELLKRWRPSSPEWESPPEACEIGWQPSPLAPVFYGVANYEPTDAVLFAGQPGEVELNIGAPTRLLVSYPSLDGAPLGAPVLQGCGRYPLVVIVHGHCDEPDHYKKWQLLAIMVARCGYVVVVPELPGMLSGTNPRMNDSDLQLLRDVIGWMRGRSPIKGTILPEPATALIGHSYGGLLAGRLAAESAISALISLSGAWIDWGSDSPSPDQALEIPKLYAWGTGSGDGHFVYDGGWDRAPIPKHKLVLQGANHWDYVGVRSVECASIFDEAGPCGLVPYITGDIVTLFLGKYLPPEYWPSLPGQIHESLLPPTLSLTPEQSFYASGHFSSFTRLAELGCRLTTSWHTAAGTGSRTRPIRTRGH